MIYTTLNKIREQGPCSDGWKKLLKHLGKTEADDEALSLLTILESNGLNDALWCLRACDGIEKEARLYAVACARRVQHLMNDQRSIDALDVAERYAHGNATNQELEAARDIAWDADATAENVAWGATWGATWGDAWGSARDAAAAAASDAEIEWQEAEFRRVFCS